MKLSYISLFFVYSGIIIALVTVEAASISNTVPTISNAGIDISKINRDIVPPKAMEREGKGNICACVATWSFGAIAVEECVPLLLAGCSALKAVEKGVNKVELDDQDQYFVGVGGLPNADGVMEFDSAIMDHKRRYGAVMALTDIKTPISIAKRILEKCVHNVLAGEGALQFAVSQGFHKCSRDINDKDGSGGDSVLTEKSRLEWQLWKDEQEKKDKNLGRENIIDDEESHDTVGLICLDAEGHLCCGTSTSGWKFKHPGRVGDSPLVGSGLYCDGKGAAVATGDGEEIMRVCLSFLVVEYMRQGDSPQVACVKGIQRLLELQEGENIEETGNDEEEDGKEHTRMHKKLTVGIIAMNSEGEIGAASTLSPENEHRGRPGFPAMCWRTGSKISETDKIRSKITEFKKLSSGEDAIYLLEADTNGAAF
jgi:isoaspartyl peptidase/L-asparaginase-like protein (Ntn-hydrolase superfamily)